MNRKRFGFTLAEVLITLTIIGIIAAITIPTLNKKWNDHANMVALKKFYIAFAHATKLLVVDYDTPQYWALHDNNSSSSERVINYYKEHRSIVKTCDSNDTSCFPFPIYASNGSPKITSANYKSWRLVSAVLRDGTTVCFDINNNWFGIFCDVNGFKLPNKLGDDVFVWAVNSEGLIVDMYSDTSIPQSAEGRDPDYNFAFRYMKNGWRKL